MTDIIPALIFDNVCFTYPGGFEALRGVTFSISPGEKVGIMGLNGSGKSTLLLHSDALLFPDSGTVSVNGIVSSRKTAAELRRHVGFVFQNSDDQLFMPTVEADVAFGPRNMGLDNEEIMKRVSEALSATGIEHLRERAPFRLSGGQKKMAAIATVLSMRPSIMVMDEPTSGLDYDAHRRLTDVISNLPHTLLISSHESSLIKNLCTRTIVMSEGRIVFDGPTDHFNYP